MTTNQYIQPIRRILTQKDLDLFSKSSSCSLITDFIEALNDSVKGLTNDAEVETDKAIESILKVLESIDALVTKHPAADMVSSRFGKPEFRDFYDELKDSCSEILSSSEIPDLPQEAIIELKAYLIESWGNRTRIDYGSGHELNFISFLLCLDRLKIITSKFYSAVVLKIFLRYISIMRRIQTIYWLEPAGSHGVWGLDDYHFLPFMFGSAQLSTHKHLRPISIHDPDILEMYAPKYMYLACIKFINSVKTASLRWHSPMLDDISGVKRWSKVNEGMIKMYKAEVLGKLPIMQHYTFGSLIPAPDGISEAPEPGSEAPHTHNHWADCCGIKVPSAIAANQMEHTKQEVLRPVTGMIPFD